MNNIKYKTAIKGTIMNQSMIKAAGIFIGIVLGVCGCMTATEKKEAMIQSNLLLAMKAHDMIKIKQSLQEGADDQEALRGALAIRDYEAVENLFQCLKEINRFNYHFIDRKDDMVVYDAEYTTKKNDGFTYLQIKRMPCPDWLHKAIISKDERLARILLKFGVPTGYAYYVDRSGIMGGYTREEIFGFGEGGIEGMQVGNIYYKCYVDVGGECRLKTTARPPGGASLESFTHASVARSVGLNKLAEDIEMASQAPK